MSLALNVRVLMPKLGIAFIVPGRVVKTAVPTPKRPHFSSVRREAEDNFPFMLISPKKVSAYLSTC